MKYRPALSFVAPPGFFCGVSPEAGPVHPKVILTTKKSNWFVRVLPEFAARNRTQGGTVMAGWVKSF